MAAKKIRIAVSNVELAALFDVHENTITAWIENGLPYKPAARGSANRNRIDLGTAIRWRRQRDSEIRELEIEERQRSPEIDQLRARKLEAESRIAEAAADEVESKQVLAADVEDALARVALAIREGILSATPRAVRAGVVTPERGEQLDAIMLEIIQELERIQP